MTTKMPYSKARKIAAARVRYMDPIAFPRAARVEQGLATGELLPPSLFLAPLYMPELEPGVPVPLALEALYAWAVAELAVSEARETRKRAFAEALEHMDRVRARLPAAEANRAQAEASSAHCRAQKAGWRAGRV